MAVIVQPDAATEAYLQFVQHSEIIGLIISGLAVSGITAIIVFFRKIIALPKIVAEFKEQVAKENIIIKAAVFRLLRSNKTQGVALTTIAACQKDQRCNGDIDKAIEAVKADQDTTDKFLAKAALGKIEDVEEELEP